MANIIIAWDNLLDNSGAITVSPSSTTYTSANLKDSLVGTYAKFTATSGSLVVDFGAATTVSFVALAGHTSMTTITLMGNATTSWAAPSYGPLTLKTRAFNSWSTLAPTSLRYWRIKVSHASAYPKAGELFLGSYTQVQRNPAYSYQASDSSTMLSGQTATGEGRYKTLTYPRRSFAFQWSSIESPTVVQLNAFWSGTSGLAQPFLLVPSPPQTTSYWMRGEGATSWGHLGTGWAEMYSLSRTFIEEPIPLGNSL